MLNDEAKLVAEAQENPQAFSPLYEYYVEKIYAYAQREVQNAALAQDIVATTFEKALKNLRRYRWQGTTFGAWLYQIARNEIRMHYRRRNGLAPLLDRFSTDFKLEQRFVDRDDRDAVLQALHRLSMTDQELLRLRYFEDLTNEEIAEVIGKSPGTTAVAIHRALKRLRGKLESQTMEAVSHVNPS